MKNVIDVRPSPIAGRWYPRNPQELAASIDGYLNLADPSQVEGEIVAMMAPHAGHAYSGAVAGQAFGLLRGLRPEIVVVISPMHYPYQESLLTSAHSAYATPLGKVPIAHETLQALNELLQAETGSGLSPVRNDPEHSLEIEIPFLQRALVHDFQLLPLMVRDQGAWLAEKLGNSLANLLKQRSTLIVASTDLSHFYPQSVASSLDQEMLHQVEALDPRGVIEVEELGKGFACGHGALAAMLWAALGLGANSVKILCHATSGDVTGDYSQVVGYASAVLTRV